MRMQTARFLGAAKNAILALKNYYESELPCITAPSPAQPPNVEFPHPTHFLSLDDNTNHSFEYLSPLKEEKLVFYGTAGDDKICIKFVRRYSKEAHRKCSSLGFAPALRGFQPIPGGWYMVVMDFIDNTYHELEDSYAKASFETEIREKVTSLHQAGYVHGDIRTTNIMVKRDCTPGIMLVDFDWAGVPEEVRYPMNVNNEEIKRPSGADDGELILADHDLKMIDYMYLPV
jgi:serine/threonine protein kinase